MKKNKKGATSRTTITTTEVDNTVTSTIDPDVKALQQVLSAVRELTGARQSTLNKFKISSSLLTLTGAVFYLIVKLGLETTINFLTVVGVVYAIWTLNALVHKALVNHALQSGSKPRTRHQRPHRNSSQI